MAIKILPDTPTLRAAFPWLIPGPDGLHVPEDYTECKVCGCDHKYSPELAHSTHNFYTQGTIFS